AACEAAIGASSPVSETQVCLATLDRIFASQCAATLDLTPCLCGSADRAACLAGTEVPNGFLIAVYQCELGSTVPEISMNFIGPTHGASQANAIVQCAAAFGCTCF